MTLRPFIFGYSSLRHSSAPLRLRLRLSMEALLSLSPSLPYRPSYFPPHRLKPSISGLPLQPHLHHRTTKLRSQLTSSPSQVSQPTTHPTSEHDNFDWLSNWYPLAPICDLDKRAPHAKTVLGLDVVVWWDRHADRWQVFDDRCPHRLAPLSEGRIDQQGRLQCVYHGWCFDGAGSCKYIPQAMPDGPPVHTSEKACATAYPCFEQNKILWFWPRTDPSDMDTPGKEKPPYIPELDDPSYTSTMGMRDLPYGYEVLIENLMDPAHVSYAHYGIMRVPKRRPPPGRVETDREGGVPIEIMIESLDKSGFLARNPSGYGKFVAPCLFNSSPTLPPTNSLRNDPEENSVNAHQRKRILLTFLCIPVRPGRSRVIWVFPRNFAVWVDQLVPRWMFHIGQNLILDSDIYLLHLEERKIAEIGPSNWQKACYVPTKSDAQVIAFRKWLRKYAHNQVDWGTMISRYLPPTPPREQLMDRYWTHVVNCSSCRTALQGLKALQIGLQVAAVAAIAILAASKQSLASVVTRTVIASTSVLCFLASKWLSHFIYKNFYFHDYNHAFR